MKLKPLGDRLIVKAVEEEEDDGHPASFSPTPRRRSPPRARSWPSATASSTTTASASRWTWPRATCPHSKYGGTEIVIEGEDRLVLRESDVLAKVQ